MACLLVAGPLNEKNLAVKLRQNPKKTVSSLPVFYGLHRNYWRPAEIASKGPARKANCGAKEKAITEFFQILYTELALNSACRAAYFCTYNLSPRKYLHPLADKGRQQ